MAEQSINLPVSPQVYGGNSRRNNMGGLGSSKSGEKIAPNYLRASTGSCHDFCKYGKKHAFEEKARHPFPKRVTKKPLDDQNPLEVQAEKKTSMVKSKPSPKICTPEIIKWEVSTNSINSEASASSDVLAVKKKKKIPGEVLLTRSADSQSPVLRQVLAKKKKIPMQEVSTELVECRSSASTEIQAEKKTSAQGRKNSSEVRLITSSPKIMNQDVPYSSEKLQVSLKQGSSKAKNVNLSAMKASSSEPNLSSPGSGVSTHHKNTNNNIEQKPDLQRIALKKVLASPTASLSHKTYAKGVARGLASPRASLSPKIALKGVPRGLASPRPSLSSKITVNGVPRGLASPRGSLSIKPSLCRTASLKMHRSLKVVPGLRRQNKNADIKQSKTKSSDTDQSTERSKEPDSDVVEEKTLYVIKMEIDNKYLESINNENLSVESNPAPSSLPKSLNPPKDPSASFRHEEDGEESEYVLTDEAEGDSFSEYDETEYMHEAETLEGENKGMHGKAGMFSCGDKDSKPVNLHFRRGKVVEIQSENNGPRRLKFRRGRVLEENEIIKAGARKNFKKSGADGSRNDSNPESGKVLLRHQDVQGKKDAPGLFNNVIEETASQLVGTQKSKVKALVGAFETVISLQDNKPPANIVS